MMSEHFAMPGPAGPASDRASWFADGYIRSQTSAGVEVGKGGSLNLGHLRQLVADADRLQLSDGADLAHKVTLGGRLTALTVKGERQVATGGD